MGTVVRRKIQGRRPTYLSSRLPWRKDKKDRNCRNDLGRRVLNTVKVVSRHRVRASLVVEIPSPIKGSSYLGRDVSGRRFEDLRPLGWGRENKVVGRHSRQRTQKFRDTMGKRESPWVVDTFCGESDSIGHTEDKRTDLRLTMLQYLPKL